MKFGQTESTRTDWRGGALLAAGAALTVGAVWWRAPAPQQMASGASAMEMVGGSFMLVASLFLYLNWRVTLDPRSAWIVAATVLLGYQMLTYAGSALDPALLVADPRGWSVVMDAVVSTLAAALALLSLSQRSRRGPDPLVLGLGLGILGVVGILLLEALSFAVPVSTTVSTGMILTGYAAVAVAALTNPVLPRWAAQRLAVSLALISLDNVVAEAMLDGTLWDFTAATLRGTAGLLWVGTAFALLRNALEKQRVRALGLEDSLIVTESQGRKTREQLHEVRSTIAGLANASRLMDNPVLPLEARLRLEHTIHAELARMERLLTTSPTGPGPVNLDDTLDVLLDVQRAKGRAVEWVPSGDLVYCRSDAVAEAVNILLDNAATHGGSVGSRVAVTRSPENDDMVQISVSDGGPGVPLDQRSRIFEWGQRGVHSKGQGIGLHLARRLVAEDGGTLTLAELGQPGSSFVIRLPAARRSQEVDDVCTDGQQG